jgi:PPIC-type PPIASE domain
VIRRLPAVLLALALAAVVAGCTTFSDNDAAARVDDVELTDAQLEELVGIYPDPETGAVGEVTSGDAVRSAMTFWVQAQVFGQAIADAGVEIDDAAIDEATQTASTQLPTFTELSTGTQDFLVQFIASTTVADQLEAPDEDEMRTFYDQGPDESGVACVSHILVDTEQEALDVLAELEGGADFATLAQERSTDEASAQGGGVLPCTYTSTFQNTYVGPFVDAALAAETGVPTGPVETDFGYHVLLVRPYDEVVDELAGYFESRDFVVARAIGEHDVFINPRYGTLDDRGVVVPLG